MSLGLVATGKRSIVGGKEYNKYFNSNAVEGKEVVLLPDGDPFDTLKLMKRVVDQTLQQTRAIATEVLKASTLEQTCLNTWNFLYKHIQYKKDHSKREQLRTPARSWKDRSTGIDCDCYSIFISSILTNLSIPHSFRMAAYSGDYQHVYVVVPKDGKNVSVRSAYYVIDPVVDKFDYEVPFKKKHDHKTMGKITMLNGVDACSNKPQKLRKFIDTQAIIQFGKVPTRVFLETNNIPFVPAFDKQNEQSYYIINTAAGQVQLPTILTQQQAEQVKKLEITIPCECTSTSETPIADTLKKLPWWWIAIGAGAWVLLTGSDQDEVGGKGLNGIPKPASKKSKRKKKSYRTITI